MKDLDELTAGMSPTERKQCLIDLCERGLVTCTRGNPGDDDAQYALSWEPLDNPEQYPEHVRRRHSENMRQLSIEGKA